MPKRSRVPERATRSVILFLAANVGGAGYLALDEEFAAIDRELSMTAGRHCFELWSKWAVTVDDVMRYFNELRPTIVHFSAHGTGSGLSSRGKRAQSPGGRDVSAAAAAGAGIRLCGENREPQHVNAAALTRMIASASSARVVVLNA